MIAALSSGVGVAAPTVKEITGTEHITQYDTEEQKTPGVVLLITSEEHGWGSDIAQMPAFPWR